MTQLVKSVFSWFKSSLRLQILTYIGVLITLLMIVISVGILLQWRTLTIQQQKDSAKSFSRAFSIPVIEALINADSKNGEVLLETHIQSFLDNVEGIYYISVLDRDRRIIAHSDLARYGLIEENPVYAGLFSTSEISTSIFQDDEFGWVLETFQPLQIGQRRWGTVIIGFNASHLSDKISASFFMMVLFTLIAICITLALFYFFINRVTSSLRILVDEVDKFDLMTGSGLDPEPRSDEIGVLIEHFRMLKTRLNESKIELENAQRQIFQAEKLASIGRLASGVAHEVNNPLNGMRFCVYSIQKDPENKQQMLEYLDLINEGLTSIESVVSKLLGYSRQRPEKNVKVNVIRQAKVVADLLDYRIKKKYVNLEITHDTDLPEVYADPNLFQEMLMNLILNSLDAVHDNGSIKVHFSNETDGLCVTVRDDGSGIKPEVIEKIFDPFYSTKEVGQGTGLGLYVTLGIVQAHNGSISVNSEVGKFTEFTILIPRGSKNEDSDS